MRTPSQSLADRLQLSIDDVARAARRHTADECHDEIVALYSLLLARKRKAELAIAQWHDELKTSRKNPNNAA